MFVNKFNLQKMKAIRKIKSLILLIVLCSTVNKVNAQTVTPSLTPVEFKAKGEKTKGIIVDVRNKNEYDFAHIKGAINIAVESEDFLNQIDSLDKSKNYFVYCSMGKRSDAAISLMYKVGFKNLYSLKGGFLEWKKEQLPIIKEHRPVINQ